MTVLNNNNNNIYLYPRFSAVERPVGRAIYLSIYLYIYIPGSQQRPEGLTIYLSIYLYTYIPGSHQSNDLKDSLSIYISGSQQSNDLKDALDSEMEKTKLMEESMLKESSNKRSCQTGRDLWGLSRV